MRSKPSQTLLIAGATVAAGAIAAAGPTVLVLPAAGIAAAGGLTTWARIRKTSPSELGAELLDIAASVLSLGEQVAAPPELLKAILPADTVAEWLAPAIEAADPTTADFWTPKRILASKIICGVRGSGKSVLASHCASQLATQTRLFISDRHYPEGDIEWLPGIPRAEFEERYLVRSAADTLTTLNRLEAELSDRINGLSHDRSPLHFLIDEWGGCWRQWGEYEQADAIQALQTISEEGRKFNVNVTVILHKLTKQDTGIDEGLSGAADLYLMGDAISQTTWTFPASLRSQRDQLLKDRRAQITAVEVAQRVMIYRDPITGDARIVVAPDLSQPQQIEVQSGLTTEAVEAAYQPGMSARKLSDALGVRRSKDNPDYQLIIQFLASKEGANECA